MYDTACMLRSWCCGLHFINDYTCFGGRSWLKFQDMNGKREVKKSGFITTGNVGKTIVPDFLGGVVL